MMTVVEGENWQCGTLAHVNRGFGWRIPLGTLTIRKSDTRKTPKKGYEESPYQSANMTTTYKPYSHVGHCRGG